MATLNDFKLLSVKSRRTFDLITGTLELNTMPLSNIDKERFGFYFYVLENLIAISDPDILAGYITDTEFNDYYNNERTNDEGVDAVYINEEDNTINLFNFKYRERFNADRRQSVNETILSAKFVNALLSENLDHLSGKIAGFGKEVLEKLNSNDVWRLCLYVVSNENRELDKTDPYLQQLENTYGLEVYPLGLNQLSDIMSIRPDSIEGVVLLDKDAIMSYTETSLSSSTSYIIRLPLVELLRITCNDNNLRCNYNLEDYQQITECNMEMSLLFDNVRGFIQKSKRNLKINKSLKEESSRFFMYNNGITMIAEDIVAEEVNIRKKIKLTIKGYQILNGGQTLRTVHQFNKEDNDNLENLIEADVLIRIFKTQNEELKNKIAENTNSQNAISASDLKSLRKEQILLEQFLDENEILYSRKIGDTGDIQRDYSLKISMTRFGQILYAIQGNPEKASSRKQQIFDKYYDALFGEENLDISKSAEQIRSYFHIKETYETGFSKLKITDQKIFFILYIIYNYSISVPEAIQLLERALSDYLVEEPISEARKLIQTRFKTFLDENYLNNGFNTKQILFPKTQ